MRDFFDMMTILRHYLSARMTLSSISSATDLGRVQNKGMSLFRRDVLVKSPFYQPYANRPLDEFPVISKPEMLEHFGRINTRGIALDTAMALALQAERDRDFSPQIDGVTVGLSSGTSGRRGVFLVSKEERLRWAGIMLAMALPRAIWRQHRIAFFLRANSNLYGTLDQGRSLKLDFYDLTDGAAFQRRHRGFIDRLNRTQPNVITAPASVLKILAQAIAKGDLSVKPLKVISVAEVLEPDDEWFIAANFGVPVHQIYQCTEGFLGISDQPGRIVLNEAFVFVEKEWIDKETGRFVPIITDFSRVAQPIVRYRLDDVLVEDRDATGPFTVLKRIEGRCDDILYFQHASGNLVPVYADAVRQAIGASTLQYNDYRIVQTGPAEIAFYLNGPENQSHVATDVFASLAARFNAVAPSVRVYPPQQRELATKVRRIERLFPTDGKVAA